MTRGGRETEIKLPVKSVEEAKRLLYRAGFRVHKRRMFEDNFLFDTPERKLRQATTVLRLRQAGGKSIVTFKGRPIEGKHKSREELETEVASAATIRAILDRLGLQQVFRYQKYRTEFKQPGKAGTATLDETPIGIYLELEGQPRWIDRNARALGYEEKDYVNLSYGRLYLMWGEKRGREQADMVFSAKTRRAR